jgi:hypothetical protein
LGALIGPHSGPVVLVAVLERKDALGEDIRIIDHVLENRREYADAHGMKSVFRDETGTNEKDMNWRRLIRRIIQHIQNRNEFGSN